MKQRPFIVIVLNRCQADEIMHAGSKQPDGTRTGVGLVEQRDSAPHDVVDVARGGALWLRVIVVKSS